MVVLIHPKVNYLDQQHKQNKISDGLLQESNRGPLDIKSSTFGPIALVSKIFLGYYRVWLQFKKPAGPRNRRNPTRRSSRGPDVMADTGECMDYTGGHSNLVSVSGFIQLRVKQGKSGLNYYVQGTSIEFILCPENLCDVCSHLYKVNVLIDFVRLNFVYIMYSDSKAAIISCNMPC